MAEKEDSPITMRQSLDADVRTRLAQQPWYPFVGAEARKGAGWVLSNVHVIGRRFVEAFHTLFLMECCRRQIDGRSFLLKLENPAKKANASISASKLSDEIYQCGLLAAKVVFNMEDWAKPNEADVEACLFLCRELKNYLPVITFLEEQHEEAKPVLSRATALVNLTISRGE